LFAKHLQYGCIGRRFLAFQALIMLVLLNKCLC
jgi:hypothetical protein